MSTTTGRRDNNNGARLRTLADRAAGRAWFGKLRQVQQQRAARFVARAWQRRPPFTTCRHVSLARDRKHHVELNDETPRHRHVGRAEAGARLDGVERVGAALQVLTHLRGGVGRMGRLGPRRPGMKETKQFFECPPV